MKRMLLVLTAAAIIAALMATSAYAQAAPESEWETDVPFPMCLPAGSVNMVPMVYDPATGQWLCP
jgi:hypothetical protein